MELRHITLEKLRDVLHLLNDLSGGKMTVAELTSRVDKSFEHWSKLFGDADKIPATMLFVAENPKLTPAEIEYGRSLVLSEKARPL